MKTEGTANANNFSPGDQEAQVNPVPVNSECFMIDPKPSPTELLLKTSYNRIICLLIVSVTITTISIFYLTYLWIKGNEIKNYFKVNHVIEAGRSFIDELTAKSNATQQSTTDPIVEEHKFDIKGLINIAKDAVRKFNETIHAPTKD